MNQYNIDRIINNLYNTIMQNLESYTPKILGAIIVLGIGFLMALLIYKFVMYLFKRFNLIELIDKLNIELVENIKIEEVIIKQDEKITKKRRKVKLSDKIKINEIMATAVSYYIFLVFFRLSIVVIGIKEVELFLGELIAYIPSLFIAVLIGFFGIRFANFVHDVVFHALDLTRQKTAKIVASGSKIIILFFTLMFVLDKIGIANDITTTILIGFVSMIALACGLAFGLGGKEIAKEILESFKK